MRDKTKIETHGVVVVHPAWIIASNFRFNKKTPKTTQREAVLEWALEKLQTALNNENIKVYISGSADGFDDLSTLKRKKGGES